MANSGSKAESPFWHFFDGGGGIWEGVGPPYDLTVLGCDIEEVDSYRGNQILRKRKVLVAIKDRKLIHYQSIYLPLSIILPFYLYLKYMRNYLGHNIDSSNFKIDYFTVLRLPN